MQSRGDAPRRQPTSARTPSQDVLNRQRSSSLQVVELAHGLLLGAVVVEHVVIEGLVCPDLSLFV